MLGENFKHFRVDNLKMKLREFDGVKISTLSAFENGRSNNFENVKHYWNACQNDSQKAIIIKLLTNYLGE